MAFKYFIYCRYRHLYLHITLAIWAISAKTDPGRRPQRLHTVRIVPGSGQELSHYMTVECVASANSTLCARVGRLKVPEARPTSASTSSSVPADRNPSCGPHDPVPACDLRRAESADLTKVGEHLKHVGVLSSH